MNVAVRTVEGVDGQTVVLAAWCPTCEQEALPHDRHGTCLFCDTPIYGTEPVAPPPVVAAPIVSVRKELRVRGLPITDDDLIAALQHCAAVVGHSPTLREYDLHVSRPSHRTVWRRYGSWSAACRAAGLDPA